MQRNSATYCDEPDDAAAFSAFLEGYDQEGRTAQAAEIFSSNPFMSELHSRLVPLVITDDTFWQRYFFRCEPCVPFCRCRFTGFHAMLLCNAPHVLA